MSALLELDQVVKAFRQRGARGREIRAVDGVSLTVNRGETLGIVGESGCGKSTVARLALRLLEPTAGRVRFAGEDITLARPAALMPVRRRMQAIFQDPLASFNPNMTIRQIMAEPFETHGLKPEEGIEARARALLKASGMADVDLSKRPAAFSGGQLQRIAIARALALEPELIIADEPTSALDPSIQAQIVNALLEIQKARGIAYMIISHDLDVLGHMADRLAVMYLGVVVETGPGPQVMNLPLHPYTQALLSAAPTLKARRDRSWRRILLPGDPPNPAAVPQGCRFHPRCSLARDICRRDVPPLRPVADNGQLVACHFAPDETRTRGEAISLARRGLPMRSQEVIA
ncbi:ABC transporter ATP-binding protein [Rhodoligotrophos defluvii]|uniref:ABC transporter ATP-binding protein n=1 Tax=Rhodoligotrophos defluvii TaxID=2561934 RepID=UPI0010C944E6|nr:ABC transporter ATP-binding protein [Rhodoligotrophos defluvii]